MDGLFFLSSILGIGLVMWWVLKNDGVRPDGPTTGMFAMTPASDLLKRRKLRGWTVGAAQPRPRRKSPF